VEVLAAEIATELMAVNEPIRNESQHKTALARTANIVKAAKGTAAKVLPSRLPNKTFCQTALFI
jgi:hypothetical protein